MASNKKSYDGAHDYKQELKSSYRYSERSETDTCPTKLKLMDREELKERCCSKCLRCFDEYDHYNSEFYTLTPIDQPKADKFRYYCNKNHEQVMPNDVRPCFEKR